MGNRFSTTGTIEMSSTGRSLVIEIINRNGKDYVSIKDMEALLKGHKKTVTIVRPNPNPYIPKY